MLCDVLIAKIKFLFEQFQNLNRYLVLDFQTDCLAKSSTPQLHFNGRQQVFGFFFFEVEVRIASHTEREPRLD